MKWLPVLLLLTGITSCNKYLEEQPSKNTGLPVSTAAQLNALLDNFANFSEEINEAALYSTDDFGVTTDVFDNTGGTFQYLNFVQNMVWNTEHSPLTPHYFWEDEWQKIFTANMVLEALDKVSGTPEEKAIIKSDAHFIRAYSYWVLAATYCLPYTEANKNEPGLPIKTATSFEEPIARATLEKTFQLIESDLKEALKTPLPLVRNGKARHWRTNTAAVHGFAARYYLNRFNYAEAIRYADLALNEYNRLVNYNTEMRYGREEEYEISTPAGNEMVTVQYPYTFDNQTDPTDMLGWKEFLYFRMANNYTWWSFPSEQLLALYDQEHDLRYKYHIVENYSYNMGLVAPAYSAPGYVFFFADRMPSGPTVAEMLLTKAEALAHTSKVPEAMTTVNTLRANRLTPGAWVNLTAASQQEAIQKILEERRREMPFTQRWFDLKRYNNNEDPNDDVIMTRNFYPVDATGAQTDQPVKTYTLEKKSRKYAVALPATEIISSNGVIEQNKY